MQNESQKGFLNSISSLGVPLQPGHVDAQVCEIRLRGHRQEFRYCPLVRMRDSRRLGVHVDAVAALEQVGAEKMFSFKSYSKAKLAKSVMIDDPFFKKTKN